MDMVERVARAIHEDAWPYVVFGEDAKCMEVAMRSARAAIAAMREPTPEMVRAGLTSLAITAVGMPEFEPRDEAELCFMSMIDAALVDKSGNSSTLQA